MPRLFAGCRAPTTLGTHLRAYTFGHVRQLDAVASRLLVNLAQATPLLGGADHVAYVDIDDTIRATHGYAKQGTGYGYTGVKGLNVQVATLSTPSAAPVIVGTPVAQGQRCLGPWRGQAESLRCPHENASREARLHPVRRCPAGRSLRSTVMGCQQGARTVASRLTVIRGGVTQADQRFRACRGGVRTRVRGRLVRPRCPAEEWRV